MDLNAKPSIVQRLQLRSFSNGFPVTFELRSVPNGIPVTFELRSVSNEFKLPSMELCIYFFLLIFTNFFHSKLHTECYQPFRPPPSSLITRQPGATRNKCIAPAVYAKLQEEVNRGWVCNTLHITFSMKIRSILVQIKWNLHLLVSFSVLKSLRCH